MSLSISGAERRERRAGGGDPAAAGERRRARRAPARRRRPTRRGSRCRRARSRPGNQSASLRCSVWSKARPPWAASWWAITTKVRSASGSPSSATTFQVVLRSADRPARRPGAVRDVVGDQRAAAGPPAAATARAPPGERQQARGRPRRPVSAGVQVRPAVEELLLVDPRRRPGPLEPRRQPFGGLALALGARLAARSARAPPMTSRRVSCEARESRFSVSAALVGIGGGAAYRRIRRRSRG